MGALVDTEEFFGEHPAARLNYNVRETAAKVPNSPAPSRERRTPFSPNTLSWICEPARFFL